MTPRQDGGIVDYVVARPMRDGLGYTLLDSEGKYLGFALTLAQAQRFALATGAALIIEH